MSKALGSSAAVKPLAAARRGFKRLSKGKLSLAAVYFGAFALLVVIVSVGYYRPNSSPEQVGAVDTNLNAINQIDQGSIDDVLATGVAAAVAQSANLPIANNVSNLAVSAQIKDQIALSGSISTAKPQIIDSLSENRSVVMYGVKDGDTVSSLAKKFKISVQTIKWANNLTSNDLTVGGTLKILPIDGILYSVKSGDTIESIAKKYKVNKTRLIVYNDLDLGGLKSNSRIILPGGILPDNERPGYIVPQVYNFRSGSVGNLYAYGNCTWYAYERREQLGHSVGSYWGNANTWADAAADNGYLVDRSPSPGAVLVDTAGWYGHVAIVESVDVNGNIVLSEMNNYAYGGWDTVSRRTISAEQATAYRYIH